MQKIVTSLILIYIRSVCLILNLFKKILAGIDGSKLSIEALDLAADIADQYDSELFIVSAVEPLPPLAIPVSPIGSTTPSYLVKYREDQQTMYKEIHSKQVNRLSEKYPKLKINSDIIEGRAPNVIKGESKDKDLIVIGHRGKGGLIDLMLGSVAKSVVDTCTVPILVFKKEKQSKE
jgi:nucleotide-binding universal stress UspA family protein